jgi:flavocytochrome c
VTTVDVVVIGSGIAGLTAANTAFEAGARRIVVAEAEGVVGGSSRLSGGIVMAAGSRLQRDAGITDDGEALFHDYMSLNQWRLDAKVVRRFAHESGPALDWLVDIGVQFHPQLIFGGDERVPRCARSVERGQGIIDALHRTCRERGIDIALGQRVDRLIVEDGTVVGAAVGDDEIRAGAVVLATGGFGNDPELLRTLYPSAAATGDWLWYIGADGARGDALALGRSVNAQVLGEDRGLRLLHADFVRTIDPYLPGWVILVDRDGRRFVDETAPYGIMDGVMRAHGDVGYVVFDEAGLRPDGERVEFKQAIPGRAMASGSWNPIMVDDMVATGKVTTAPTIEALAEALGLPAAHLVGTVERYNAGAAAGEDDFAKAPKFLAPIAQPPFYGAEVRPATLCFTACGLRIDADTNVLDDDGRVIAGLFAVGECTGSVVGEIYMGSGNSLANGAAMGRVAGRSAAARALAEV